MLTKCLTTIPNGSRPQAIGGRNAKRLSNESVIWSVLHGDVQPIRNNERAMPSEHGRTHKVLGVPFNIAQYSLLAHMVAHQLGCEAVEFTWVGADVHIYQNHVDAVHAQLREPVLEFPTLEFTNEPASLFDYTLDDFKILNYEHAAFLPAGISIQGQPGKGVAL